MTFKFLFFYNGFSDAAGMTELVDVADLKSAAIVKRRTGSTPVPGTTKLLFASPLIPLLEYRSDLSGRWLLHRLFRINGKRLQSSRFSSVSEPDVSSFR